MSRGKRTKQFEVPKELIGEFFRFAEKQEMEVELIEVDQDEDELVVQVEYAAKDRGAIMFLIEMIDDYNDEEDSEDDEDDEDGEKEEEQGKNQRQNIISHNSHISNTNAIRF